jgi:small conductance mechanosensitive channel
VAVAIGFLTRNLLEDILNGALILCTDRFAIGDVITVGDKGGLVEDMNLHVTSLRGTDGQLTTIPNRRIDVVDNVTQRWSRVDFTVRVAAAADPRQALAVVEAEAQRFWQEPEWQELLMAPPDLLGIDEISHAGTLIRVWIATRPLKQWLVGRQFRLRIKLALEAAGIELGMPQQRISLRQRPGTHRRQDP